MAAGVTAERSRSWAGSPTRRQRHSRPTSTSGARRPASRSRYDGNTDFQTAVIARATAGNPPDIAIYPQPGVLKSQTQSLFPLEDLGIDVDAVTADEANGLGDIAVVDGQTFGLPYSINVKSLVWYNPAAFEAAGLTVPTTDAELTAVQQQIIDDGLGYPWCVGLESGGGDRMAGHRLAGGVRAALRRTRGVQRVDRR